MKYSGFVLGSKTKHEAIQSKGFLIKTNEGIFFFIAILIWAEAWKWWAILISFSAFLNAKTA